MDEYIYGYLNKIEFCRWLSKNSIEMNFSLGFFFLQIMACIATNESGKVLGKE